MLDDPRRSRQARHDRHRSEALRGAIYLGGHATGGASVDGRPVAELAKTIVATGVYLIHLPEKNILGAKQRSGRSAAYGEGLLLSGFSRGTHSIVTTGKLGKFHAEVTDTVTIG